MISILSGSSSATCATIGKMSVPEITRHGCDEKMTICTLAGSGTPGLLIPPSIMLMVYGFVAQVSIARLFISGFLPGFLLVVMFVGDTGIPRALAKMISEMGLSIYTLPAALAVFSVIFVVTVVEVAQMTPPVEFDLFVPQYFTGRNILYVAKAALPFFFVLLASLPILVALPEIALWQPNMMLYN